jgi:hypothetical protein
MTILQQSSIHQRFEFTLSLIEIENAKYILILILIIICNQTLKSPEELEEEDRAAQAAVKSKYFVTFLLYPIIIKCVNSICFDILLSLLFVISLVIRNYKN